MRTRPRHILLVAFLLLLINLPTAQATWSRWQVEGSGESATATLVDHEVLGSAEDPRYWLAYRVLPQMDAGSTPLVRRVDKAAYDNAVDSGQVTVLVRDGDLATSRAEGQVVGRTGFVVAAGLNVLVLAYGLVLWRFGSRWRRPAALPTVRIEATGDLLPAEGEPLLDELAGGTDGVLDGNLDGDGTGRRSVLVRGTVSEITDHDVVLLLSDRTVIAVLDGHKVLVADGELGQVRGRYL